MVLSVWGIVAWSLAWSYPFILLPGKHGVNFWMGLNVAFTTRLLDVLVLIGGVHFFYIYIRICSYQVVLIIWYLYGCIHVGIDVFTRVRFFTYVFISTSKRDLRILRWRCKTGYFSTFFLLYLLLSGRFTIYISHYRSTFLSSHSNFVLHAFQN